MSDNPTFPLYQETCQNVVYSTVIDVNNSSSTIIGTEFEWSTQNGSNWILR